MIEPFYQSDRVTLYNANCLAVLPQLAAGSVDAVVTDPPYGVDYKDNGAFDDSEDNWLANIAPLQSEMARVSAGPVLWFGASPTMQRDLNAINPHRVLIWAPKFSLSGSRKNGVFFKWHPIYCWSLPKRQDGFARDVLTESTGGRNAWNHPATKPVALMERLVRVAPDKAAVLDPFMGSGTTGVAAIKTGRKFIGIELDAGYCEIAKKRIVEAEAAQ